MRFFKMFNNLNPIGLVLMKFSNLCSYTICNIQTSNLPLVSYLKSFEAFPLKIRKDNIYLETVYVLPTDCTSICRQRALAIFLFNFRNMETL